VCPDTIRALFSTAYRA